MQQMMIRATFALFAGLFAVPGFAADGPVRSQTPQPTQIPGDWAFDAQPLPPLETVAASARANPHIYGLYTWANEYRDHRDSIQAVGWQAIRHAGPFDDQAMQRYVEDGVEVMLTVSVSRDIRDQLKTHPRDWDRVLKEYPASIATVLNRYGPDGAFFGEHPDLPRRPITHVEITNEPNFQYLIPPDGRPRQEVEADREALYAQLLPAAYAAAKAHDPSVKVVGFGAGGASAGDLRFIKHVHELSPAAAKSYDLLSTHPYVAPAPPEAYSVKSWGRYSIASQLEQIRRVLGSHGRVETPIWYTEIGWSVSHADGGHFRTSGVKVSPLLQAAYVCRLYAWSLRLGVERVHIMFATDTDNYNGGFFLRDGGWRPSAHAVQTMIRIIPEPRLIGSVSDGDEGYFAYRFDPSTARDDAPVVMAWNVHGPRIVEIPIDADRAAVTDMLGKAQTVAVLDGRIQIEVGPLPMYIQAEGPAAGR